MHTTTFAPFDPTGWTKMSIDERGALVAPFYADYLAARQALGAGKTTEDRTVYNDELTGRIPGLAAATSGTTPENEQTGIYLLQTWHRITLERAELAAFVEAGAFRITFEDVPVSGFLRGTAAVVGEYSGGTGYRVYEDVRIKRTGFKGRSLVGLPKGRRTSGFDLSRGRELYFLPASSPSRAVRS